MDIATIQEDGSTVTAFIINLALTFSIHSTEILEAAPLWRGLS
jgi:hypothetical protein